jgi:hypothetical protein
MLKRTHPSSLVFWALIVAWIVGFGVALSKFPPPNAELHQNIKCGKAGEEYPQGHYWKCFWERTTDDPVALLTLGLLFFAGGQALLFLWQLDLIRKGLADTKNAADAAKKSADALPALERAYMFIETRNLVFPRGNKLYPETTPGEEQVSIFFQFVNHGRTPAVITSLDTNFEILTEAPDNTLSIPPNMILENDTVVEPSVAWGKTTKKLGRALDSCALKALEQGHAFMWLYGSLTYQDIFGESRITRFRWRYDGRLKWFHACGGKPYNERT